MSYSADRYSNLSNETHNKIGNWICNQLLETLTLHPYEWLAFNFPEQYHLWVKHEGLDNKENDRQLKKSLIVKQILLASVWELNGEQYGEYAY